VRVDLKPLPGGRSRAAVFQARLFSRDELGSITCVVKVAPRRESREERDRYESFARLRVASGHRAEMLVSRLGDTVGAAAYALAEGPSGEVGDLEAHFAAEAEDALVLIDCLFGQGGGDLWRVLAKAGSETLPPDLGAYFASAYRLDALAVGALAEEFLREHAPGLGLVAGAKGFQNASGEDGRLALPSSSFYGSAKVRTPYRAGVIHGDLNPTNVLTLDDKQVRLIDFRHARVGPIALDFAAQEAGVRLAGDLRGLTDGGLIGLLAEERRAVKAPWGTSKQESEQQPYWMRISRHLGSLCRELTKGEVSAREYRATCLLYALRIFRANSLGDDKRARLLPWIAALHWALNK
jgi:hypothetical protein